MLACTRMQIDSYLLLCTKLKSRWIRNLNISPDKFNQVEEKAGNNCDPIGIGDTFLNRTPIAQTLSIINKWDFMTLASFCKAKDTIQIVGYRMVKRCLPATHLIEG